jgi:hypothetical protein
MKKILFFLVFVICANSAAQVPMGMNYQAIATDTYGHPLNSAFDLKVAILSDTIGAGNLIWEEIHHAIRPNSKGLFSIVVGKGTRTSGVQDLSSINWSKGPLFLRTTIIVNGISVNMGYAQLWAVPYSILASGLDGPVDKLEVVGEDILSDEALFEVKRKDGNTIFAVYNHGVRINMPPDTLTKGKKGGFAIGGFDAVKGVHQDYFVVNTDSIRAYINTSPTKGKKGGFAIGGFGTMKAGEEEYLRVTGDSTLVNIRNSGKSTKGGFAIGGLGDQKNTSGKFMNITRDNYFIGHNSGANNTTGIRNSVLGYESAVSNTEGFDNVFLGYHSGYSNKAGMSNIFIGTEAGFNNIGYTSYINNVLNDYGSLNVFIGKASGYSNLTGFTNLFVGNYSGFSNKSGVDNTYIGNFAGEHNIDGFANVNLGAFSGRANENGTLNVNVGFYAGNGNKGSSNVFIGPHTGEHNVTGSGNVYIGSYAGMNSSGQNNIFIGNNAGADEIGSDRLYISNSATTTPLIGGIFNTQMVGINRMPQGLATLEVGGSIWANGQTITAGVTTWSDMRFKKNILPLSNTLSIIMQLQGVTYSWRQDEFPQLNFPEGSQIGLIAQDVEKVIPEVVTTGGDGYKSVSYEKLVPVLIESIKDQQRQIDNYNSEIQELKEQLRILKEKIETIGENNGSRVEKPVEN